ncbi:MAG: hypothetical protein Q7R87_02080 [Nanoarchaeota archaeon]|nr:hypothetical protein [Nanoarchaeota archaeon]
MDIDLGLNNTQIRYLEKLISDPRRPYYDRVSELGSFLHTKILLDEERHAIKRLVNKTTFSEYESMSKLGSYEELSVWYDLTERAINRLDNDFNANKSKLHNHSHESFVSGFVQSKLNGNVEEKRTSSQGKRTSLLSLIGVLFRPFYRKA